MYVEDMVDLAQVNGISNLCAFVGVLSAKKRCVISIGSSSEHIGVVSDEDILSNNTGQIVSWFNACPLSALDTRKVSLIHLDVEKHEGEVLC